MKLPESVLIAHNKSVQATPRKLYLGSSRFAGAGLRHVVFAGLLCFAAYKSAQYVIDDDVVDLMYLAAAVVALFAAVKMLAHWRTGFYFFLTWLVFEDFFRKYLGNSTAVFFVKDVALGVVYLSFFMAYRRKEVRFFRPPFLFPLLTLVWMGLAQVFNPASPSLLFGILGLKLYFLYVPLFYVGYELVTSEVQLRQFFFINAALGLVVCSLGIAQSIMGPTFLNPATLSEEIREMGNLYHVSPISGVEVFRASSVFVSPGRYADFLVVCWLLALGFSGYLLLRPHRGRAVAFVSMAVTSAAIILTGSRGPFMWSLGSLVVTWVAFVWGAPWRKQEAARLLRAFQRSAIGVAAAFVGLFLIFPDALSSRLTLYTETLSPNSPHGELGFRAWDYPLKNFLGAFDYDRWPYGYGIGTASLGAQYIKKSFHISSLGIGVESGFGTLVLEMGLGGLILWIVMSAAILVVSWREVKKSKGTALFPIAFVIFLYAFILLLAMTFMTIGAYQDFILNAYLWILLGILFRLRSIAISGPAGAGHSRSGAKA